MVEKGSQIKMDLRGCNIMWQIIKYFSIGTKKPLNFQTNSKTSTMKYSSTANFYDEEKIL